MYQVVNIFFPKAFEIILAERIIMDAIAKQAEDCRWRVEGELGKGTFARVFGGEF